MKHHMVGAVILYHILFIALVAHFSRKGYVKLSSCEANTTVSAEQPYERDAELDQLNYEAYILMEETQELVDIAHAIKN